MSNFQRELDLALALAEAKAERDAARADADRLAEAAETFLRMEYRRGGIPYEVARASLRAALAA